jgi:hypothetical protein
MRKFVYIILFFMVAAGCEKESGPVNITYRVSQSYSPVDITFLNREGNLENRIVEFSGIQDVWQKSLQLLPGEIVYLSAVYGDPASAVKVQIIADGKVFKEGSSVQQPNVYVTVSGVIPY